jgi:hypothetical protein
LEQSFNVGLKAGVLFPGTVDVEGVDLDLEAGPLFHASVDLVVAPKLSLGAFLLFARTQPEDIDRDVSILTLGATIKGRFIGGPGELQLRPGIMLGYQKISVENVSDDSTGMDVGAVAELSIPFGGGFTAALIELGFITQPVGGNDDAEITFGPIFFLTGGIEFGG